MTESANFTRRIIADALLVVLVIFFPGYIAIGLSILFVFYFDFYIEILLAGFLIDLLYSQPGGLFFGDYKFTIVGIIVFLGSFILKKRLKFYE